jgi:hypothetical protein
MRRRIGPVRRCRLGLDADEFRVDLSKELSEIGNISVAGLVSIPT